MVRGRKSEIRDQWLVIFKNRGKPFMITKNNQEVNYEVSKSFPSEESYSLTSQIRRSSRSVCLNLRETWSKRRYEAHIIS